MTREHKVLNVQTNEITMVPYTQAEEDEQNTIDAQVLADAPMTAWKKAMKKSDTELLPRHMEDLITDNPDFNIHEKMKTRYDEKVALRATQPKE
jgi:hypothetical protein